MHGKPCLIPILMLADVVVTFCPSIDDFAFPSLESTTLKVLSIGTDMSQEQTVLIYIRQLVKGQSDQCLDCLSFNLDF